MKTFLLILLFASCPLLLYAQGSHNSPAATGNGIRGKVRDISGGQVVEGAFVEIRDKGGSYFQKVTTDSLGNFFFSSPPASGYNLSIIAKGYHELSSYFNYNGIGMLALEESGLIPDHVNIGEITVKTTRILVQQEADKTIYHVAEDPQSRGSSLLQIMKKVPGIQVENNKDVLVNGSSSYMVLVNGRKSALFLQDPADVFKSFPASAVKQLEILATPPSRYESEGSGGVINLVLDQYTINGYRGSAGQEISDPVAYTGNGYLTGKSGILGINAYGSYNTGRDPEGQSYEYISDKIFDMVTESDGISSGTYNRLNYNAELNVTPDAVNLFSATLSHRGDDAKGLDKLRVLEFAPDNKLSDRFNSENTSYSSRLYKTVQADYERRSKEPEKHLLTLSVRRVANENENKFDYQLRAPDYSIFEKGLSGNDDRFTEVTAQVDYVYTYDRQNLELGIKSITRKSGSDYYQEQWDIDSDQYFSVPVNSSRFSYTQSIVGGYSSYNISFSNYSLRLGVRAEAVTLDADFISTNTSIEKKYFNLIPNVRFSGRFKKAGRFNLAYTKRVQRPGLMYLNPYVNKAEVLYHYFGNPDLDPAISNVFNLNYNLLKNKNNYGFLASHSFSTNAIQSYYYVGTDSILYNTFGNIGQTSSTGVTISLGRQLFGLVSFNVSGSARYRKFTGRRGGEVYLNERMIYSGNMHMGVSLWEDGYLSSSASYSSGGVNLQGRTNSFLSTNLSLSWDPGGSQHLSFNFSVDNPIRKMHTTKYVVDNPQFYLLSDNIRLIQAYTLSVNYRFGKFKGVLKRKARDIVNDDQVE
jgi:hypothetical protein